MKFLDRTTAPLGKWTIRLFIGGIAMVLAMAGYQARDWYQAGHWTNVDARVIRIERSSLTGGSKAYDTIYVAYQAGGQRRVHSYERTYADAKIGQLVTVLVDPRDPERALRRRGDGFRLGLIGIAMLIYTVVAATALQYIESRR